MLLPLFVVPDGGAIQSFSQDVKAVDFWSLQNSVRLINWNQPGDDATIKWRQPENKVCVHTAGTSPGVVAEEPDPWKHCDITSFNARLKKLWGAFDENADGLIDAAELTGGFASNLRTCCGGAAATPSPYGNQGRRHILVTAASITWLSTTPRAFPMLNILHYIVLYNRI